MKTTSVIIATYNGERFIEEQLDSIASQTILPTEVIISDDGSTDNTMEVINNYLKAHDDFSKIVTVVSNITDDHGPISNFENAIHYANGDYVFFCDQDDVWCRNKVEKIISAFENNKEKVIIHNARVLLENENNTFLLQTETILDDYKFVAGCYRFPKSHIQYRLLSGAIPGMCMVVERDYLLSLMPFPKAYMHDQWIQFCSTADETIVVIDRVLSYYRIHQNNLCGLKKYNFNKKAEPLFHRLLNWDKTTVITIRKQTIWWTACYEYALLRDATQYLNLDNNERVVSYFVNDRRNNLEKGKIQAIISLIQAKNNGMYHWDGIRMYLHELAFILMHTRTK